MDKTDPEYLREVARARLTLQVTEMILEWMESQGITEKALAKRLNMRQKSLARLLNNQKPMTLQTLSDICYALGQEIAVIPRRSGMSEEEMRAESHYTISKMDPEEREAWGV